MLDRSILTTGMRRWFFFIAATSTFLVANGFYLWLFESMAVSNDYVLSYYYIGNVLAHLVVGLLFGIPFVGFVISHLRVTWRHRNDKSRRLGIVLAVAALLSLGTGVWLMIAGALRDNYWILVVHIVVAMAGVLLYSLHRWASTRAERLTVANLKEVAIIVVAFVVLSGGHFVGKLFTSGSTAAAATPASFMPSPVKTADGALIPASQLTDVEYCRQCHADAYAQWKSSAHSHSSFTNIFYARSVDRLQQTTDPNRVRWCAGCHDPAILLSGGMQSVATDQNFTKHPFAGASITCITCHSMQSVSKRGDGEYTIAPPTQYPFATSTSPILRYINRLLISVKPEPHRRAFMKPFHKTSEFCASCHKVSIPFEVNDYKWQRGQNEYDAWHNSGISWNKSNSFYRPKEAFSNCAACHMPTVPSSDMGSVKGLVHFHAFPAANTALAAISGDTAWLARTVAFLKMNRISLDLFAMKRGREIFAPLDAPQAAVVPGETVELNLVVRNRSVGHRFPGGTVDAQQVWVELIGTDANGQEFFHSGAVDSATHHVDSTAHFYHSRIFTREGDLINTRAAHLWTATLFNNFVGPGSADVVLFNVEIPPAAGAVTFTAKLHYKKFDEKFTEFVYAGQYPPILPDVVMSEKSLTIRTVDTLPPAASFAVKSADRERFNDYGIGTFLQGNSRDATWSWRRVTQIDSNYAEGYINLARVELKEGYLPQAAEALDGAERAQPGYFKTKFFRGQYLKKNGRLDEALTNFMQVHDALPLDRDAIDEIGRIHYLRGNEYEQAIEWYSKELAIDPEEANAHYNIMQCYRALGNSEKAEFHHQEYLKYKDDETQRERTQRYRNSHPADNNEAQAIHYHRNALPPAAVPHPARRAPSHGRAVTLQSR